MIKKYIAKLEQLGLSFKKELALVIIFDVIIIAGCVALTIFTRQLLFIPAFIILLLVIDYLYLTRYKSIEKKKSSELVEEFITIFSYFEVYLNNGYNVYSSLKEIAKFANPILQEKMNQLFDDIDNDKSVNPFITFASNFNNPNIEQLLVSIYQMIDEGNNSPHLKQFDLIFSRLKDDDVKTSLAKKEKSLGIATLFPLIGAATLIIMITIGVIGVIGSMVNGI